MPVKSQEKRPDWETSNVGLMLFTSLMILLLAFFIMLSSMAVIDEQRQIEALGSLLGAFGMMPGGLSPDASSDGRSFLGGPLEAADKDMEQIRAALSDRIAEGVVSTLKGRDYRIVRFESGALFAPGSVAILEGMKPVLKDVAEVLKKADYPLVIEGHTDDQPPQTEAFKDNWQVSALRALEVFRFLSEECGVDPKRMSAFGYAGYKPAAANTSPRNRARNNRIDLVLDFKGRTEVDRIENEKPGEKGIDFKGFYFKLFGSQDEE